MGGVIQDMVNKAKSMGVKAMDTIANDPNLQREAKRDAELNAIKKATFERRTKPVKDALSEMKDTVVKGIKAANPFGGNVDKKE